MRKFTVTTEKGNEYIVQITDRSAKEIAHLDCMVYERKESHDNPVMLHD